MINIKAVKSENLWYIIGLIAADGNLSKDGRHIEITSKDEKILVLIKKALNLQNKISKKSRCNSKEKIYPHLAFGDVHFYKFLLEVGLTPKKSLTLGRLSINHRYFPDFLRGVIDGDGCISTWIHKTNLHRQWALTVTSGAPLFIKWLKKEVEKYFCVKGRLYNYKYRNKVNDIYILKFGKLASKVILAGAYRKNVISLGRKNKKHLACLQDENRMVNYGNVLKARVMEWQT